MLSDGRPKLQVMAPLVKYQSSMSYNFFGTDSKVPPVAAPPVSNPRAGEKNNSRLQNEVEALVNFRSSPYIEFIKDNMPQLRKANPGKLYIKI